MTAERRALIDAWAEERAAAKTARSRGDLAAEWHHLERAHILSQPMAGPHVRTHVSMLGYGLRRRDRREKYTDRAAPEHRRHWRGFSERLLYMARAGAAIGCDVARGAGARRHTAGSAME